MESNVNNMDPISDSLQKEIQEGFEYENTGVPAGDLEKEMVAIICIGMAGSGKTSFLQRLNAHLHGENLSPYIINLDPAVANVSYTPNIDIRSTVNYKEVMKQYGLGPNGGILTALNLFTTKFDQVLDLVDKKKANLDYLLVDTPGQIEIFTWSASGAIITETLAVSYPTVVAYIIDTPRTISPATFMSNMLYACSILYKTKLPFVLVFNKTDVVSHKFAEEWMTDFESFQEALSSDTSYMGTFISSMCLVLEEFYKHLRVVGCSAVTGQGMDDFFDAVKLAVQEYKDEYKPALEEIIAKKEKAELSKREADIARLVKDLSMEEKGTELPLGGRRRDDPLFPDPDKGEKLPFAE
ncbi:hypothetical protein DSO57_1030473 [Entomophthora muscae]|uniref:Uncharacterized protein n=1 Tax=Entomophthora muscae TaxID=34485 RepID=A0ACC2TN72_9FUNG|nr:hypothetical protein DSO57_1030473 [Entomophthora muscae]